MTEKSKPGTEPTSAPPDSGKGPDTSPSPSATPRPKEIGGPKGPEPTRYGDWERNGRVSDF